MRLRWTRLALADFDQAHDHIAKTNPQAAQDVAQRILDAAHPETDMNRWWPTIAGLALVLPGCSVTRVAESRFLGECKELLVPHYMAQTRLDRAFSTRLMLTPEKIQPDDNFGRFQIVGEVPTGTRIVVHEILRSPKLMGAPPYLRVTVKVLEGDYEGTVSDVPSCALYHPRVVRWITNCTLDPDQLQFNPEFAKACDVPSRPGP